jgi:hypothetical protein
VVANPTSQERGVLRVFWAFCCPSPLAAVNNKALLLSTPGQPPRGHQDLAATLQVRMQPLSCRRNLQEDAVGGLGFVVAASALQPRIAEVESEYDERDAVKILSTDVQIHITIHEP